jgi:GNAT superfamily N-acetyltransferase
MVEQYNFSLRPAASADIPALSALIDRSGRKLSVGYYTDRQAVALTQQVFGVDSQLVADGTYYAIEDQGAIVACGGWGRRSTRFGGDRAKSGPDRLLDPRSEAARIRAFFVEPGMARRGLGSMLMTHCAAQAAAAGFRTLELVATLPGEPLYLALGFCVAARFDLTLEGGLRVPLARMHRSVSLDR